MWNSACSGNTGKASTRLLFFRFFLSRFVDPGWGALVTADPAPLSRVPLNKGGTVAAATPQRVGKRMRPCRLMYFCAFGNSRSPSVRAGLAFSGEADPPLKMRATLSLRRLIWLALHMEIAIRNTFCAL
jgi:hypothetical protein